MTDFSVESERLAPEVMSPTRPMYWSVRRELWENRSIYLAPLAVAAIFEFGFLISTITLRHRAAAMAALTPAKQRAAILMPYNFIAGLILMTAFLVGVFYCLDALYGERRDRGILFWKSLPVSDRNTVLAKAGIPLAVLPVFVFAVIVSTQLIMLLINTAALVGNGHGLTMLWTHYKFVQTTLALLYTVIVIALWHAPLYAWVLLISAWARRAPFLWAILPLMVVVMFEKIAFGTRLFDLMLRNRMIGWLNLAFVGQSQHYVPTDPLTALTPGRFLAAPGLWLGLIFAAGFLAAAIRLRRNREPI
jgi:ABC-2 type transport system permease protein